MVVRGVEAKQTDDDDAQCRRNRRCCIDGARGAHTRTLSIAIARYGHRRGSPIDGTRAVVHYTQSSMQTEA